MSVVENSETSDASMRTAASRAVTQVLTVNNMTTEIRFGVDEYIPVSYTHLTLPTICSV